MKRACLLWLLVLLGCSSNERTHIAAKPGENVPDSGPDLFVPDGSVVSKGSGAGGINGPASPIVEITEPKAARDPNQDTVLTDSSVTVHCKVTRSTDPSAADVNKSSVVITLDKPDDPTKKIMPAVNARAGGDYDAVFDLAALPNGSLHFRCEAKDLAAKPHVGEATLDALHDNGPKIEFAEPKPKGIYTLKTPVAIQFQVTPHEVAVGDEEAGVTEVLLTVGGVVVPVTESTSTPGFYQTTIDFDDRALFPVPPTAAEVRVTAQNRRTPTAAKREAKLDIIIDGDGPVIKVETPGNVTMVHGDVVLRINISDSSGVKKDSVVANINSDMLVIKNWEIAAPIYQQRFDTRVFPVDQVTELTINITAADSVGNQSTASLLLRLDNRPPLLSLDPPLLREAQPNADASKVFCSEAFDPVGEWATSDLQTVKRSSTYRVLIIDQTNYSPGSHFTYHADVAKGSVVLYAQENPSIPLLVDTNGDGVCDEINDPPQNRPVQVKLSPLDPKGAAYFHAGTPYATPEHTDVHNVCKTQSTLAPELPQPVCPSTDMFRVVPGILENRPPAVYALNPTNSGAGECEGTSWELASALGGYQGWTCLAARAEDNIGNIGISAPMRVCINDGAKQAECDDTTRAPSCLGTAGPGFIPCKITNDQLFPRNSIWPVH